MKKGNLKKPITKDEMGQIIEQVILPSVKSIIDESEKRLIKELERRPTIEQVQIKLDRTEDRIISRSDNLQSKADKKINKKLDFISNKLKQKKIFSANDIKQVEKFSLNSV